MTRAEPDLYSPRSASVPGEVGTLPRLLIDIGGRDGDLRAHLRAFGQVPYRGGSGALIDTVEAAGLTGRGGAAFPTHRKLRAVAGGRGPAVVVANAAEGEPAAAKDKELLRRAPHLLLDGLQLAAEAVGARTAYLYVHRDPNLMDPSLIETARRALADRRNVGLDAVPVEVVEAPPRFLAGEESALASLVSGGEALPRFTPPRVFERGVGGAPTLVQNAETLAHLALIGRYGATWFRRLGTADEPGSMLCTVHNGDRRPQVVEAALGTPLDWLVDTDDARTQAVLVGGYHGTWLTRDEAAYLKLSNASLRPLGASLGAGVLAALPADRCGLAETARVARYLAAESAGQCGPCLNGLPRIASALAALAGPHPAPGLQADLARWAGLVERRGACHHPDGTVRFVRSALVVFADEIERHSRGSCRATDRRPFLPVGLREPDRPEDWR